MSEWKRLWALSFAAGTFLGLIAVGVVYVGRYAAGRAVSFGYALIVALPDWYFWALFAPLVVWLARRFRIERQRWLKRAGVHLAVGVLLALLEIAFFSFVYQTFAASSERYPTYSNAFFSTVAHWFPYKFLVYWLIVVGIHAFEYYRHYRQRELIAARLETQLVGAQLQALRMQLHPHFLFNTLHTISVFMRERRTDEAIEMIALLGNLLRQSLDQVGNHETALADEVRFIENYLEIERIRFGDRLRVRVDIPSATRGALVPNMILQPVVENAIRHGIAQSAAADLIELTAEKIDGMLRLCVRDNGPGFRAQPQGSSGTQLGLANTRSRLQHLYGSNHSLETKDAKKGGAEVTIDIPFCAEPVGATKRNPFDAAMSDPRIDRR